MSSPEKRRDMDIMKLAMHDFKVEICKDDAYDIVVDFHGPKNTLYSAHPFRMAKANIKKTIFFISP